MDPLLIILLGLILALTGVALPLLMVVNVIQASYALAFLSFACSIGGVLLGVVGASRQRLGRGRRIGE